MTETLTQLEYIHVNTPEQVREYCEILLDAGMYVPNWGFQRWFRAPERVTDIFMCLDDGKIIGVGVIIKAFYWKVNNGVLVNHGHRRQGIGTELLRRMSKEKKLRVGHGISGSDNFFQWCKNIGFQINLEGEY
jgi:GNAT superfamily N-acetyltransferase